MKKKTLKKEIKRLEEENRRLKEIGQNILISEPKGVYGADFDDDLEPVLIKAILLSEDGQVEADTAECGITKFDFDFVGSLEELRKFKNKKELR